MPLIAVFFLTWTSCFMKTVESIDGPCHSVVCYNGGKCDVLYNPHTGSNLTYCKCQEGLGHANLEGEGHTEGHSGEQCEYEDEHSAGSDYHCRNGGYHMPCHSGSFVCPLSETCVCPEDFVGFECEYKKCPTENNPTAKCLNGICPADGSGCVCLPGFHGESCGYQYCDGVLRCVHGECVGGQCHCSHGYSGLSCDERDCDGLVCLNDAYCHLGQCICPEGVYGLNCEVKECSTGQPCYRGQCSSEGICQCFPGYAGRFCQLRNCGKTTCGLFSHCNVDGEGCRCSSRYIGEACDVAVTPCGWSQLSVHYCDNGGKCPPYSDTCYCPDEYRGDTCDIKKEICGDSICPGRTFCVASQCCDAWSVEECEKRLGVWGSNALLAPSKIPWYVAFFVGAIVLGSAAIALAFFIVPNNSSNQEKEDQVSITSKLYKIAHHRKHPLQRSITAVKKTRQEDEKSKSASRLSKSRGLSQTRSEKRSVASRTQKHSRTALIKSVSAVTEKKKRHVTYPSLLGSKSHDKSNYLSQDKSNYLSQDKSGDLSQNKSHDPSQNKSRDLSRDLSHDPSHDPSQNKAHDPSQNKSHDLSQSKSHDLSHDRSHDWDADPSDVIIYTERISAGKPPVTRNMHLGSVVSESLKK